MSADARPTRSAARRATLRGLLACSLGGVLLAASLLLGPDERSGRASSGQHTSLALVVSEGSVLGGARTFDVERGQRVTLEVTADVIDEVHVHGYDIRGRTTPRRPVDVVFTATIPGEFDVELEGARLALVTIRVRS